MTKNDLTILVVGAGANADFRLKDKNKAEEEKIAMPTGEQLVEKIANWEEQVLPNLYWGFIAKIAEKYGIDSERVANAIVTDPRSFKKYPVDNTRRVTDSLLVVTFLKEIGLIDSTYSGFDIKVTSTVPSVYSDNGLTTATDYLIGEIVDKIQKHELFSNYHKISEIVKHYQPFSIDEMLDSIKVGKIDVSKWTGKTENDENERKELIKAGKDLIALFLLQSEDKKVFDYESVCWYRHLRNAIITCGKNKKEIEEKLEDFVIISFNYDRSLDYFLRTRVSEFYDKIRVIYPYGSLAENDIWDSQKKDYQKLPYGAAKKTDSSQKRWENFQKARELAADLKVIGELGGEDTKEIKKVITSFGRIYFLGFAFHEENCRVLGMEDDAFKNRLRDLRGKSVNDIFYTNLYSSLKIKSGFDSIFNRARADSFELGKTSQKGSGTYDALSQDFDFRLTKPTR